METRVASEFYGQEGNSFRRSGPPAFRDSVQLGLHRPYRRVQQACVKPANHARSRHNFTGAGGGWFWFRGRRRHEPIRPQDADDVVADGQNPLPAQRASEEDVPALGEYFVQLRGIFKVLTGILQPSHRQLQGNDRRCSELYMN